MKRPSLPDANRYTLREMQERGVFDDDEFEAWLAERRWSWQALDRGEYGLTLEDALVLFVFEDPVRWCETFMLEPRTGKPWKFFDYQKESLRAWRQDTVHQDGAEVGKTREIVCLSLWIPCTAMGFTVSRPWTMTGAPQQTHLDEIIMAVEEQVGAMEDGQARGRVLSSFWLKPKRTPHTMHRFLCPPIDGGAPGIARNYYRPAGHDGEAFRGVHVNGALMMDEAAKLKRFLHWSEFWRAGEPGCIKRVWSVPDGDTTSGYSKILDKAIPNLPEGKPGWRLFQWPKSIMPPPYWTPEREAEFARLFDGRNTPAYHRNVLGLQGPAENPIWTWETIMPNVVDLPAFRAIKLRVDARGKRAEVEVRRIELQHNEGRKVGVDVFTFDGQIDATDMLSGDRKTRWRAVRAFLREHLAAVRGGVFYIGADLGEVNDPTEIVLSERIGKVLQDCVRINASGMPYYLQRDFAYCLQELYKMLPHWGVDLGAAGTVVVKDLQTLDEYADAHFDEVMTGFQFSNAVDCIDEDGNALERDEKDGEDAAVVRAPAKHWATQCISARLQSVGYAMAFDAEALQWMTSHTKRQGAKWPIYAGKDDHNIDARRMQMLRMLYDELGGVDLFSSGVHTRAA